MIILICVIGPLLVHLRGAFTTVTLRWAIMKLPFIDCLPGKRKRTFAVPAFRGTTANVIKQIVFACKYSRIMKSFETKRLRLLNSTSTAQIPEIFNRRTWNEYIVFLLMKSAYIYAVLIKYFKMIIRLYFLLLKQRFSSRFLHRNYGSTPIRNFRIP